MPAVCADTTPSEDETAEAMTMVDDEATTLLCWVVSAGSTYYPGTGADNWKGVAFTHDEALRIAKKYQGRGWVYLIRIMNDGTWTEVLV